MNIWKSYSKEKLQDAEFYSSKYIEFLSNSKTERECVLELIRKAKAAGFKNLEDMLSGRENVQAGDGIYSTYMNKCAIFLKVGKVSMEQGMAMLCAHVDSPRLDVKPNPFYEKDGVTYCDTHYYGGIKKYQWVTMPWAIHGVVILKTGEQINVIIGESEDDPVFCISDLPTHLSKEQMKQGASEFISGESLDLMMGMIPADSDEENAVKKNVLKILEEKFGMSEEDFLSAELEVVPAGKAREAGIDRSLIMGYGQDDRALVFAAANAFFEASDNEKTLCCMFADKEEIGDFDATSIASKYFEQVISDLMEHLETYSERKVRRCFMNSKTLCLDASTGYDPMFSSRYDKKNVAYLGKGVVFASI